jgi:hypothetical protein
MLPYASDVLAAIANTLSTCPLRSPLRPALSTTYSLVLSSLGGAIDPEEGKKSLARVWRCVLEDISAVASTVLESAPQSSSTSSDRRKAKKQKTYDPSESMTARRVSVDELDLDIAKRGLATLERLLAAPHAHFLPPKLHLSTSRLLLFLALDPAFFSTLPLPTSTSSSTFFPATSATRALDIARQDVHVRRGVVRALRALCAAQGPDAAGLNERALSVWALGSRDADAEIKAVSIEALGGGGGAGGFGAVVHPRLPPLQVNQTFARQRAERVGRDVGDEEDLRDGVVEFIGGRRGRGTKRRAGAAGQERMDLDREESDGQENGDDDDDDEDAVEKEAERVREERRRKMEEEERRRVRAAEDALRRQKEQAEVSARGFVQTASAGGFSATTAAPAAASTAGADEEEGDDEQAGEDDLPEFVQVDLPQVAVTGSDLGHVRAAGVASDGEEDSSDDDDEAMPTIHVGSDEE